MENLFLWVIKKNNIKNKYNTYNNKDIFEKTLNKLLITKNDQYQSQIPKKDKNNISPDKMPKEQHIT